MLNLNKPKEKTMNQITIDTNQKLQSSELQEALEAVTFPVERQKLGFDLNGKKLETQREVVFRPDVVDADGMPTILGYVSPGYTSVSHADALNAAHQALTNAGLPFEMKAPQLDRNGARMYTQFEILRSYQIENDKDILQPTLTLVNGLDGYNALGFDLESMRLVCLNLAKAVSKDVSLRFMHSKSVDVENLPKIAAKALSSFEDIIVPHYRDLSKIEVSKDIAVKAVAVAVAQGAIPLNVASFTRHCIESDRAEREGIKRTAWAMFNAFTWASTKRGFETSPTNSREIRGSVGRLFADKGVGLLKAASALDNEKYEEIISKIAV
jgi:hypothetical protein